MLASGVPSCLAFLLPHLQPWPREGEGLPQVTQQVEAELGQGIWNVPGLNPCALQGKSGAYHSL